MQELQAGWEEILRSPRDGGPVVLIVRRPRSGEREVLQEGMLDLAEGLVGDNWRLRGSYATADGSPHPEMQLTLMNSRAIALVAKDKDRWPLAGDQLYIDLDLSDENLPPGSQLTIGSAVIEITAEPHTGCRSFTARFGKEATRFVNSREGKRHRLRGANAKVIQPGKVRLGDTAHKLPHERQAGERGA
jgi:hypothetical protein